MRSLFACYDFVTVYNALSQCSNDGWLFDAGWVTTAGVIGGVNLAGFAITATTKTHKLTDLTGSGAFVLSVVACAW